METIVRWKHKVESAALLATSLYGVHLHLAKSAKLIPGGSGGRLAVIVGQISQIADRLVGT